MINPAIKTLNATGITLTQAEKDYANKTYFETGQDQIGRETVEQWTDKRARSFADAKANGYIPANVTFIDNLKLEYPESKRTAFKADVTTKADAGVFKKLDEEAAANQLASETNYLNKLNEAARKAREDAKPFFLKTSNLLWEIPLLLGVVGGAVWFMYKRSKKK